MRYSKQEIIDKMKEVKELKNLYTNKIVNYLGTTTDTTEKYTEIIAKEILENSNEYKFETIKTINREKSYKIDTHDGIYNPKSPRREEIIAMKMYKNDYLDIGKILDYQIPLKDKQTTKAGKIDLISLKQDKLYLIELKNDESKETLLRCILEIITYMNQIDKNKLKSDFKLDGVNVKPAILIFKNTRPCYDMNDEYVKKLIDKFQIDVFVATSKELFNIEKIES